jgi:hypothetical protein
MYDVRGPRQGRQGKGGKEGGGDNPRTYVLCFGVGVEGAQMHDLFHRAFGSPYRETPKNAIGKIDRGFF